MELYRSPCRCKALLVAFLQREPDPMKAREIGRISRRSPLVSTPRNVSTVGSCAKKRLPDACKTSGSLDRNRGIRPHGRRVRTPYLERGPLMDNSTHSVRVWQPKSVTPAPS